jgi:hypothetical protein
MIDPASVGATGRSVRCARCKSTWFAAPPKSTSNVTAFVDGVIAEAEAQSANDQQAAAPPPRDEIAPAIDNVAAPGDDFGNDRAGDLPHGSGADATPASVEHAPHTDETQSGYREDAGQQLPGDQADALGITDAPSLVPPDGHDPFAPVDRTEDDSENHESFEARRQRLKIKRQKSKRTSRWTAVILVLFAFNVALIGARSEVVRYLPQTASLFAAVGLPVNLRHLSFENVKIVKEEQGGVSILIIEGMISNTANSPTDVPRLRFAARNATGQDVYTWTAQPSRNVLGPKESMEFHSRLAAPPADAIDVMVRFFTAKDAAEGVAGGATRRAK